MSSILTNSSALTALRNLANTQNSLSKTQSQISTGLKVAPLPTTPPTGRCRRR